MEEGRAKVLDSLQVLCSRKECCTSELMQKALRRLEGDTEAAREVVESLVADGYADDSRYAAAFAREKSSLTGWGPAKIRQALAFKGIPAGVIRDALGEIDRDAADAKLDKLLSSKWKTLQGDPYARFKLLKYALSRGYDYEEVKDRIASIEEGSRD